MIGLQEARAAYGGWLLLRGDTLDRVAGGRYLAQALITAPCADHRSAHVLAAVVDSLHALSMYALAGLDRRRARASMAAAVAATGFAAAEVITAARGR